MGRICDGGQESRTVMVLICGVVASDETLLKSFLVDRGVWSTLRQLYLTIPFLISKSKSSHIRP